MKYKNREELAKLFETLANDCRKRAEVLAQSKGRDRFGRIAEAVHNATTIFRERGAAVAYDNCAEALRAAEFES